MSAKAEVYEEIRQGAGEIESASAWSQPQLSQLAALVYALADELAASERAKP